MVRMIGESLQGFTSKATAQQLQENLQMSDYEGRLKSGEEPLGRWDRVCHVRRLTVCVRTFRATLVESNCLHM